MRVNVRIKLSTRRRQLKQGDTMRKKVIKIDEYQDIANLDDTEFMLVAGQMYNAGLEKGICILSDVHTLVSKLKLLQEDIESLIEKYEVDCPVCDEDEEEDDDEDRDTDSSE